MYIYIYIYIDICIYIYTSIHEYIYVYLYIDMYIYMPTNINVHINIHTYIYLYIFLSVYMYIYNCTDTQIALTWSNTAKPDEVLFYKVEIVLIGTNGALGAYETRSQDLSVFGYTVTGLQTLREYSLRVSVRNYNVLGYVHTASGL